MGKRDPLKPRREEDSKREYHRLMKEYEATSLALSCVLDDLSVITEHWTDQVIAQFLPLKD